MPVVETDSTQNAIYEHWLNEIANVTERVARGDLEARLIEAPDEPHLHRSVVAINRMLDQTDAFVREARVALDSASKGRFHRRFVLRGMRGSFRLGAQMINQAGAAMARQALAIKTADLQRAEMADQLENTVKAVVESVGRSATKVRETAQSLAAAAERTRQDASEVGHASLRTSNSVQSVATSTDELANAFVRIEHEANESARVVDQAVNGAGRINVVIGQLNEASKKIGGVIRIISQIARQTNLLALNATIEAARSGEAGRGFAVVASEVKHLAQQTAAATEEIEKEVGSIQSAASQTASAIAGVSETIHSISGIARSIADSVNGQRQATHTIRQNVQEAAHSTQLVTATIDGFSETARLNSQNASELLSPSKDLLEQAAALRRSLDEFLISIRTKV